MSILGNRVPRKEDPTFLTVGGTYVDDLRAPELAGALRVAYVRSTMAHARLVGVDTSAARAMPGVVAVYTSADLDLAPFPLDVPMLSKDMPRPWLADGTVRYVGEPIAAIVAESRAAGVDAAEQVVVEYEPLPVVVDAADAARDDVLLFPAAGTNTCFQLGGGEASFDGCEVVVRQRVVNQRVAAAPLEGRAAAATVGPDGRLWVWLSTQGSHPARTAIANALGRAPESVRVLVPDVGGGFGAKGAAYPEDLLLAWITLQLQRPVRHAETRTENMSGLGHGRGQVQDVTIGGTRDGRITAYRLEVLQDGGAYPRMGAILPFMTRMMLTGTYALPQAGFSARAVVTNTTPMAAYRGAGRPEAAAAIERAVDLFAAEAGLDPAEVRRINLVPPDAFPYKTATGTTYDSGEYRKALDTVLAHAGYDALRAEQAERRRRGDRVQMGIGMSTYVEITSPGGGEEWATVEVLDSGRVRVRTGTTPYGQGHVTTWSMLVAEELGVPMDLVDVEFGDSDFFPSGSVTGGSRSVQLGGQAAVDAAGLVLERARRLAAELLEANPDDIVVGPGGLHVAGTPAVAVSWAQAAATAASTADGPLAVTHKFTAKGPTFPFGAHLCVVDVDTETGKVDLVRYASVDDAGTIVNDLIYEGQVHGGVAQGVAQALFEEVRYDADGNLLTSNFADYAIPAASELCSFERVRQETPTPLNDLGAKGVGEAGTIGATPAVHNAVVDALAHLGVRHVDMPCTPERVWRAITAATVAR